MAGARVLAIDDDPRILRLVSRVLVEAGFEVVATATGGDEGVRRAGELRPAAVILDYELGDTTGAEVAPSIRAACPEVAIVGLSSIEPPETDWCDAFLLKSDLRDLAGVLGRLLRDQGP